MSSALDRNCPDWCDDESHPHRPEPKNAASEAYRTRLLADIHARLSRPAKLRVSERDDIETAISNLSGNGFLTDAEYRDLTRAVRTHI